MLEKDNPEMPLKTQADLLGISYSSLFYGPIPPSERELAIKRRIDEIFANYRRWVEDTMTTEDSPYLRVAAVFIR